jgi:ligand-binding sensor domain-containing protein
MRSWLLAVLFILAILGCCFPIIAVAQTASTQAAPAQAVSTLDARFGADKLLARYGLDVWQSENGMPSSTVLAVVQTSDGYIWMGTFGGLVRFDGVQFTTFNSANTPQIKANGIFGLHEDRAGGLWAATQESGIVRYHHGAFSSLTLADGLSDDFVRVIEEDSTGVVWIGTNKGLDRLTRKGTSDKSTTDDLAAQWTITAAKKLPKPITDRVNALCVTKEGLWVGCNSKGLFLQTQTSQSSQAQGQGTVRRFGESEGLKSQSIFAIHQAPDGTLWVGTGNGVFTRSAGSSVFAKVEYLGNTVTNAFYHDREGNLWIATDGSLQRLAGGGTGTSAGSIRTLTKKDGLSDERITSIMQDKEGSIWLGTYYGGLNRLKRGKFTTFTEQEGLLGNVIYSILPARDGSIWLGMIGGVQRWNNGVWTNYSHDSTKPNSLAANAVRAVYEDRDGTIWVGMYGGLSVIRQGRVTNYSEKNGLVGNRIRTVRQTRDGTIWIGTTSGLNAWRVGKGVVATYTTANGLPHNSVIALHEDRLGRLWIGTDGGGVVRFSLQEPSTNESKKQDSASFAKAVFTVKQGLGSNVVLSIYEETDGAHAGDMWLCTARGLSRLREKPAISPTASTIASLTLNNGLPGESIAQVMADNLGQFWIGSQNGIMCVDRAHIHAVADGTESRINARLYKRSDGMRTDKCNIPAQGSVFPDGTLWFPTTKGLVIIDPRNILTNKLPPPVVVSTLFVDTLSTTSTQEKSASITIPYGSRKFEFQYTALSFLFPEKVLFKYKLDGFDDEWTEAGTRRAAYYTNLQHGDYEFHVIACNNDGVWNNSGAVLKMTILPPWWETWWFRVCQILFFVVLLGISFAMNRYGTRTRVATVITFITILVIFEALVAVIEGYFDNLSGGVPVLELLMNVALAAILSPMERLVSGYFEKQRVSPPSQEPSIEGT